MTRWFNQITDDKEMMQSKVTYSQNAFHATRYKNSQKRHHAALSSVDETMIKNSCKFHFSGSFYLSLAITRAAKENPQHRHPNTGHLGKISRTLATEQIGMTGNITN